MVIIRCDRPDSHGRVLDRYIISCNSSRPQGTLACSKALWSSIQELTHFHLLPSASEELGDTITKAYSSASPAYLNGEILGQKPRSHCQLSDASNGNSSSFPSSTTSSNVADRSLTLHPTLSVAITVPTVSPVRR
jgi:hypothetical protein